MKSVEIFNVELAFKIFFKSLVYKSVVKNGHCLMKLSSHCIFLDNSLSQGDWRAKSVHCNTLTVFPSKILSKPEVKKWSGWTKFRKILHNSYSFIQYETAFKNNYRQAQHTELPVLFFTSGFCSTALPPLLYKMFYILWSPEISCCLDNSSCLIWSSCKTIWTVRKKKIHSKRTDAC